MRRTLAPLLLGVLAAACGKKRTGPVDEPPTQLPESVECGVPPGRSPFADLTFGPGVDGVVFKSPRPRDGGQHSEVGRLGAPCATATSREACETAVAAATAAAGWRHVGTYAGRPDLDYGYGVVTRGDDVRVLATAEELQKLVAPIESLKEAVALARLVEGPPHCSSGNARTDPDGFVLRYQPFVCDRPTVERLVKVARDGTISVVAQRDLSQGRPIGCYEGRRPIGFVVEPRPWLASLPAHVAEIAHMEAAAVVAFAELRDELRRHGAPGALVARVERARRDEVVHAAIMTARAEALGARPRAVAPPVAPPVGERRTLFELALDNATEGCVHETYGALVAAHQARHAADPALRRAFARIARDEAAHAALALDLADWLATRLDPTERAHVEAARAAAWRDLTAECARLPPAPEVVHDAGMPTAPIATALVTALHHALAA
ncbi:MAG: ferritin-like domain-containing protein [Labilithrix sp.]|nr:ferritin-like domain-containing protein [Labilithrix sp.]MCW5814501.1 ferritin-like domain-containing protein [Labilithrix sp.]